jgi:SAM-dependent methyltransferase
VLDIILKEVIFAPNEYILDAGCGTGHTLFELAKMKNIYGKGISLSEKEVTFANSLAKEKNLLNTLSFKVKNFETPIEESYDKIIGIESIKHCRHPAMVLKNLCQSLSEKGTLIIADDFTETKSKLVKTHQQLWHVPGFTNLKSTIEAIKQNGKFQIQEINLTSFVKKRPWIVLRLWELLLIFFQKITFGIWRSYCDIYLGAIILEILYVKKEVSYFIIIATKI